MEFEDPNGMYIFTDEKRLKIIIMNLINNAIKFIHRGHIDIKLSQYRETKGAE
jgi:signal transduction histidine kinase